MDWKRAKNLILVMLIVVNVFLLGAYIYTERSGWIANEQAIADAVEYLGSQNIFLDPDILPHDDLHRNTVLLVRDYDTESSMAKTLIGGDEESRSGGIVRFTDESGEQNAIWRSGGLFEANFTVYGGDTYSGTATTNPVINHLISAGFTGGTVTDISDGELTQFTLSQQYDSLPIFNGTLTATCAADSKVYTAGRWCVGTAQTLSDAGEQELTGLLIRYAQKIEKSDVGICKIESVTPGYMAENLANFGVKLVPAWEIKTTSGTGYISAVDGTTLS